MPLPVPVSVATVHTILDYTVMTVLYLFGTAMCTSLRWALWMQRQRAGTKWRLYWESHLATNLTSVIVAFVVGTLWMQGRLKSVSGLFEGILAGWGVKVPEDQVLPAEYGTAMAAGFFFDLTARWVVRAVIHKFPSLLNGEEDPGPAFPEERRRVDLPVAKERRKTNEGTETVEGDPGGPGRDREGSP